MVPEADAARMLQELFGREAEARGFTVSTRRWSWVRYGKDPVIEEIGIGASKGSGFRAGWSAKLTFLPRVTSGGNLAPGPSTAIEVDPLDHPDRYDLDALTTNSFRSSRRFARDVSSVASCAFDCATGWFDRITDVASLLPLFDEQITAPVTRFGFDHHPSQRLALAFVHSHLGDAMAARAELDLFLDQSTLDITERRFAELRTGLHRRLDAVAPKA